MHQIMRQNLSKINKGVFRTLRNIYDGAFLLKYLTACTSFTHCFSVFIVEFEQANAGEEINDPL